MKEASRGDQNISHLLQTSAAPREGLTAEVLTFLLDPLFFLQYFVGPSCSLSPPFKVLSCVTKKLYMASKVKSVKVNVKFQPSSPLKSPASPAHICTCTTDTLVCICLELVIVHVYGFFFFLIFYLCVCARVHVHDTPPPPPRACCRAHVQVRGQLYRIDSPPYHLPVGSGEQTQVVRLA